MKITQEEVTHVANLSKLKFSPEENLVEDCRHGGIVGRSGHNWCGPNNDYG